MTVNAKPDWPLNKALDVAKALDWVRRRMGGKGLVLVAVGEHSIAYAKDPAVGPIEGMEMLRDELATLQAGFEQLNHDKVTRGHQARQETETSE